MLICIHESHIFLKSSSALILLGTIFVFYTIPLTAASKLATPDDLLSLFPEIDGVSDERLYDLTVLLSGLLTAAIWSAFFALCPILFQVSMDL